MRRWRQLGFGLGAGAAMVAALMVVVSAVASYPTSTKSFTTRVDGQTIVASWFNDIHDEVVAIENGLRTGLAHSLLWSPDATYDLGASGATRPRDLFLSRNAVVGGTLTVTGAASFASGDTTVVSSTTTSNQNNWAPGIVGNTTIFWSGAGNITITGFAGGVSGLVVTFRNTGSNIATFSHNSGSSSAGNKLKNTATSAGTPVAAGGSLRYQYDGTDWQMIAHEQGAPITATFAAGDFTALTAGTWTVASGDVGTLTYHLRGRILTIAVRVESTTVAQSGGNPTVLQIASGQWGGYTPAKTAVWPMMVNDNGGGVVAGYGAVTASATQLQLVRASNAQWSNATDATSIFGTVVVEVS